MALFPSFHCQALLGYSRDEAEAAVSVSPFLVSLSRATIKQKLVAIARSTSLALVSVRRAVGQNLQLLRPSVKMLRAKRIVIDDVVSRYPPWGDQVRELVRSGNYRCLVHSCNQTAWHYLPQTQIWAMSGISRCYYISKSLTTFMRLR